MAGVGVLILVARVLRARVSDIQAVEAPARSDTTPGS